MVKKQQVWKDIIHPMATVLGAWGGFPPPPKIFQQLVKNELVQYLLVFLLTYQGGGNEDIALSLMVTVGLYLVTKILNLRSFIGDLQTQPTPPPPQAPPMIITTPEVTVQQQQQQQQPTVESFYHW